MRRIVYTIGCLLLLTTEIYALDISFTPQYWEPDLAAQARIKKGFVGEKVDFSDDLGMDDEGVIGGTVDKLVGLSGHVILSYWTVDYDGKKVLPRTFDYNGETYVEGSRVKSAFDFDALEFSYANDVHDYRTHRVGFLLGLNWYMSDIQLTTNDPAIPFTNDDKLDLFLPMAGGRFWLGFLDNMIQVSGQMAGLWWHGSGWWDADVKLSVEPIENLTISGGYRYIHLDVSQGDDSANLKLDGPTISATYLFE
jgi:hypothetical protein